MRHTCRRVWIFQFPDRRRPVSGNPARFLRRAPGRVLRFPSGYALLFLLKFPSDAGFLPAALWLPSPWFPAGVLAAVGSSTNVFHSLHAGHWPIHLLTHIRSSGRKRLFFCFCHSCVSLIIVKKSCRTRSATAFFSYFIMLLRFLLLHSLLFPALR